MKPDQIAKLCHEVNRAYCESLGDFSQPTWDNAPQWQKESAYIGVELHINNPEAGPEASHVAWMQNKIDTGWTYGPVKDAFNKTHPCIVDFNHLPTEQKAKDYIFRSIVNTLSTFKD